MNGGADRSREPENTEGINQRANAFPLGQPNEERTKRFGLGHEAEGELRDNAQVGLGEQAIERWAATVWIEVRCLSVRISAEARSEQLAVGQDHLQATGMGKAVALRAQADAAFEDVTQYT